ncbi:MAG: YhcH/YjgK/YiaL family protein [Candidatus Gastranaerophilales bacterium]|nr:YhcH/YjgK/YiaL family protein [Candidatus Gastranaerophilales bacterium]
MIYDRLKNKEQYYTLHKNFKKAFEFLANTDLKNIEDGSYEIDGKTIYANVQSLKTKLVEDKKWEVHRKYIDIQYVISGEEKMGYGILEDFNEITQKYDTEKDVEFLNGDKFNFVDVQEGDFVIFYPNDVHAPMLSVNEPINVKKVIVKIAYE